jgi:hypothetical protein
MKITSTLLKPLIYGTWLLRITNDSDVNNSMNYLIINNDTIKFKSLNFNNLLGIKKSRTAYIENLIEHKNDTFIINFRYLKKNTYAYSFLGIEIPEIKTKSEEYNKEKNITVNLFNNVLLIVDNDLYIYYVFDLYLGKIKYPNTETTLNTFMFTQIFGLLIGILLNQIIH